MGKSTMKCGKSTEKCGKSNTKSWFMSWKITKFPGKSYTKALVSRPGEWDSGRRSSADLGRFRDRSPSGPRSRVVFIGFYRM
jgi:hypothetical protein